jgi:hypothetical protein
MRMAVIVSSRGKDEEGLSALLKEVVPEREIITTSRAEQTHAESQGDSFPCLKMAAEEDKP